MTGIRTAWSISDCSIREPVPFPRRKGFGGGAGVPVTAFSWVPGGATPGYVAGEMLPGRWMILLGLVSIPDSGLPFRLSARVSNTPVDVSGNQEATVPRHRGPGWYRGDCHAHTFHSDAKGAPEMLHEEAKIAGLDFLFITDHNNMTAWSNYFRSVSSGELLFLPGMEITTLGGHANALGISRWVDFRVELPGDPAILAQQVALAGGLLSINHDKPPIPWRHPLPRIDCMEVWQRHWLAANEVSPGALRPVAQEGAANNCDRWQRLPPACQYRPFESLSPGNADNRALLRGTEPGRGDAGFEVRAGLRHRSSGWSFDRSRSRGFSYGRCRAKRL